MFSFLVIATSLLTVLIGTSEGIEYGTFERLIQML